MANWFAGDSEGQRPLLKLLLVLRVPLLALAGFVLFAFDVVMGGVAQDAARYVAMDRPHQLWLLAGLATLAGTALRFCSELTLTVSAPSLRTTGVVMPIAARALLRLTGAAPGFLLALRFYGIVSGSASIDLAPGEQTLVWIAVGAYSLVGLLMAALPHTFFVVQRFDGYTPAGRLSALDAGSIAAGALLLLTAIFAFFLFWDWRHIAFAQFVGPFGVLLLWAFAAAVLFTPVAIAAHVVRLPLLSLVALAAFAFSLFDLNDNHEFRTVDGTHYFLKPLSLVDWLEERKDIDLDKYEHYPVFVVAAEGGGLRAAYFTARVLKTLQTICPAFALHTIAISGVSGGSVGATSFVQLEALKDAPGAATPACNIEAPTAPNDLLATGRDDLEAIYSTDHLSPLIGATFFADALQRILPVPFNGLDRARAIECSFERSMAAAAPSSLQEPCADRSTRYSDLYGLGQRRPTPPFMYLMTTSVTFGVPFPIGPRKFPYRNVWAPHASETDIVVQRIANPHVVTGLEPAPESPGAKDLQLSTAAFLSARFPFILPAARFPARRTQRVLDGGLFEDSGTWFAERIARELRAQISAARNMARPTRVERALLNARIHVLIIRATPCQNQNSAFFEMGLCSEDIQPVGSNEGLNEIGSPIRALLRARVARGRDALSSLCDYSRGLETKNRDGRSFGSVECDDRDVATERRRGPLTVDEIRFKSKRSLSVPLTWTLSRAARHHLDAAIRNIPSRYWPGFADPSEPAALLSDKGFSHVICLLHLRIGAKRVHDCKPPLTDEQILRGEFTPPPGAGAPAPSGFPPAPVTTPPASAPVPPVKTTPPPAVPQTPTKPQLPELDRCENCTP